MLFLSSADQLEEQVGAVAIDAEVADLVDDQQPGDGVELELILETALLVSRGEDGNHVGGGSERHPVAGLDALEAEPDCVVWANLTADSA